MIALHKVDSALETWRTITAEMLCCDSPPKCRAFIVICVNYAITTQHQRPPLRDVECHESGLHPGGTVSLCTVSGHLQDAYQAQGTDEEVSDDPRVQRHRSSADEGVQGLQPCVSCREPDAVYQKGPRPARPPDPSGAVRQLRNFQKTFDNIQKIIIFVVSLKNNKK